MDVNPIIILTTSICTMAAIVYLVYRGITTMINNHV